MKSYFKLLLFALSIFLLNKNLQASNCIPSGTTVTLTRQSEVDSFPINYPGCDVVDGSLVISGNDIVNLNGLRNLKYTNNVLEISNNPYLTTLDGLNSLSFQGSFNILNNPLLINLNGLDNLNFVTYFTIKNNSSLINLRGLEHLKKCSLFLQDNISLVNLKGLDSLNTISGLSIENNQSLVNLEGLNNLDTTQYQINIVNNFSLLNIEALNKIKNLYAATIENNPSLINLRGLHNIRNIQAWLTIKNNSAIVDLNGLNSLKNIWSFGTRFIIENNQNLKNLNGLHSLSNINGYFYIEKNPSLLTLNGLNPGIQIESFMFINENRILSCCYLAKLIKQNNQNISLYNNDIGCSSVAEVMALTPTSTCCITSYTKDTITICQGQNVKVGIHTYTSTGIYNDTIHIGSGCDSIIITNLTVRPKSYQILTKNFCIGQSFTLSNGKVITSNGTYKDTIPNVCESIIEYHLNFVNNITTSINASICKGKIYTLPKGKIVSLAGIYKDTLPSSFGCDSIITTNLTITNPIPFNNNVTICSGKTYTLPNGNIVKTSGIYRDTILQANTCDSIVITNLTVNTYLQSTQTISVCLGKSYMLPSGRNVNQTGIYKDTIQNVNGCDSIITTNLTITNPIPFTNNISICNGKTYTSPKGNIVSVSGIYKDTLQTSFGCDSIIITNLSVFQNKFSVSLNPIDTIDAGNSIELKPIYQNQTAVNWSWLPNVNLSCNTCENPTATPIQTIQYILNAKSMNGCEDTATTTVVVRQLEVYIPTAFSPNNDGVNDKLSVFATNPKVFSLRVYNRYGELVFESHDVNNKWNGTFNGQDCTVDSYSFVLEVTQFNNKQIHKQGSVLLVR